MVEVFGGVDLSVLLLLVGAGLVIAEAFIPGAHFIVLGVALLLAGLVGLFLPGSLGFVVTTLILAAIVIVVGGSALYAYRQFDFYGGKGAGRTSDSESLRGKTGRVIDRVTETSGRVKLDEGGFNPNYQARTVDGEIPEGEEVMVIDPGGGNVLTVESVESVSEDEIDRELARERDADDEDREPDLDTA